MILPKAKLVAVDTETSGRHPDDGARVASVGLAWEGGSLALPFDQGIRDKFPAQLDLLEDGDPNLPVSDWAKLLRWLGRRRTIWHNAKFDLTMFRAGTRHWEGEDLVHTLEWDSMLVAGELDPRQSRGLDAAAQRAGLEGKTGQDELKAWLKKRGYPAERYDLVPWHIAEPYVRRDAEQTFALYKVQAARVERGEGHLGRLRREYKLLEVLYRMEHRGIGYDAAASLEAAEELEHRADELERKMPFRCNINDAKRYFFDELGLVPDRKTDKGAPSLDEEQVRRWSKTGPGQVKWAAEYALVSKARRAVSMWYRGYPEKLGLDGRLRCSYKQGTVKSGRMSVERIQLQAMPKSDKALEGIPEVRSLLRAAPGKQLLSLDLHQAELKVAAEYAQCKRMLELLAAGEDLHGITCEQVLKVKRDDVDFKLKRDIAKRLTFGAIFMIGGKTFQETLSKLADIQLPLRECEQLVADWRQLYPEFEVAYKKAMRKMETRGWVRVLPNTPYESQSWLGPRDYAKTGWNRVVQGSLAEFLKLWLIEIEANWPGQMVLTVHDSVVLEVPDTKAGRQVADEIAGLGGAMATDLLMRPDSGVRMTVDVDRW